MGLTVNFGRSAAVSSEHESRKEDKFRKKTKFADYSISENREKNGKTPQLQNVTTSQQLSPIHSASVPAAIGASAVALASIAIAIKHGKNFNSVQKTLDELSEKISQKSGLDDLKKEIENLQKQIKKLENDAKTNNLDPDKQLKQELDVLRGELDSLRQVESSSRPIYERFKTVLQGREWPLAYEKNTTLDGNTQLEKTLREQADRVSAKTFDINAINKKLNDAVPKKEGEPYIIRLATSEFNKVIKTGGMGAVPRELMANYLTKLSLEHKNVKGIVDIPMYLGSKINKDFDYVLKQNKSNGTYEYLQVKKSNGAVSQELATGLKKEVQEMEIYEGGKINKHKVEIYTADNFSDNINYNLIKDKLTPEMQQEIENGNLTKLGNIEFIKDNKTNNINVKVHYTAKFYKDPEFVISGNDAAGIYSRTKYNSERNRFAYFSKFVYENIMNPAKLNKGERPEADLIIGNDWQTGPLAALFRLLTPVKAASGEIPENYKAFADMPFATLVHNAGLAGNPVQDDVKIIESMFGKNTSYIAENAYMPNIGLSWEKFNGLMHQHNIHPQSMATNYSDTLIPVSGGYGNEISTHKFFGKDCFEIFKARKEKGDGTTLCGITNGSDKENNIFKESNANILEKILNFKKGYLEPRPQDLSNEDLLLKWHNDTKLKILKKYEELANEEMKYAKLTDEEKVKYDKANADKYKLKLYDKCGFQEIPAMLTDLSGVNAKTPVFTMAGRMSEQKGTGIMAEAMIQMYKNNKNNPEFIKNPPVFYFQGIDADTQNYSTLKSILRAKKTILEDPELGEKFSKRIVVSELFSEKGSYDSCRLFSDFFDMPSKFEPCGLAHKETQTFSGAIPIVTKTGGLTDGLKGHGIDHFAADYDFNKSDYENGLEYYKAMQAAYDRYQKDGCKSMFKESLNNDFSWLKGDNSAISQYDKLLKISENAPDIKIIKLNDGREIDLKAAA